jgi:protein gp37
MKDGEPRWTGRVRPLPEKLDQPLRWKKPRRIFVNSTSDLFYEKLDTARIDEIFAVMALAGQHQFQVLTKRVKRMREYTNDRALLERVVASARTVIRIYFHASPPDYFQCGVPMHLPRENIWLGASAEDQLTYDARRRDLDETRTAVVWWSLEPLLGPIRLGLGDLNRRRPNWVVVGGESGPHARPTHPDWVRRIRDECLENKVPFFFKQWGEWVARDQTSREIGRVSYYHFDQSIVFRVGKSFAGRDLDGVEWNQYPQEMIP